jgi:hypothetical protein
MPRFVSFKMSMRLISRVRIGILRKKLNWVSFPPNHGKGISTVGSEPADILRIIHELSACEDKKPCTFTRSALLGSLDVFDEIHLLACGYSALRTVRGCRARATMLARFVDGQGRPLRQRELHPPAIFERELSGITAQVYAEARLVRRALAKCADGDGEASGEKLREFPKNPAENP